MRAGFLGIFSVVALLKALRNVAGFSHILAVYPRALLLYPRSHFTTCKIECFIVAGSSISFCDSASCAQGNFLQGSLGNQLHLGGVHLNPSSSTGLRDMHT